MTTDVLIPQWRGPARVRALFTTRSIEVPSAALRERLPAEPVWLTQVHGNDVAEVEALPASPPRADAAVTRTPGVVLTVRTADCLPVLLAGGDAGVLAVAHAGWRGLAAGVLEATLRTMRTDPRDVAAWIGPGIGPRAFEVGRDVYDAYCDADHAAAKYFARHRDGKWLADLAGLARHRLAMAGVTRVDGGQWCTYTDSARFFSYRREKGEGRMALAAWIAATD